MFLGCFVNVWSFSWNEEGSFFVVSEEWFSDECSGVQIMPGRVSSPRIGQGVLRYSSKQSFDNLALFGKARSKRFPFP